jgi:hypothetical protein
MIYSAGREVDGSGLAFISYNPPLDHERRCHLCLSAARLTKEHVPPEAAFNGERRLWERFNPHSKGIDPDSGAQRGPSQTVMDTWQGGFYVRTLCRDCNSRSGQGSAAEYVRFVRDLAEAPRLFTPGDDRRIVRVRADTLLVARQIAVMILAIQDLAYAQLHGSLRAFARGEIESTVPPFRVLAFLVPDDPAAGTVARAHGRVDGSGGSFAAMAGEISLFPFGFVFADELGSGYRPDELADITAWFSSTRRIDRESVWMSLPRRLTVLDSVHGALGNHRRGPQIDSMPSKR